MILFRTYWESASVRSLTIQHVLRHRGVLNPPSWRTQVKEDYLVCLMLYGGISPERVSEILTDKFPGHLCTAESVIADFEAMQGTEGSWEWWFTKGEADEGVEHIMDECGFDIVRRDQQ